DPLFAGFLGDLHPPHAADGVDRGGTVVPRIADTRAGLAARARPPFRLRLLWRSSRLPAYSLKHLDDKSVYGRASSTCGIRYRLAARLHRGLSLAAGQATFPSRRAVPSDRRRAVAECGIARRLPGRPPGRGYGRRRPGL